MKILDIIKLSEEDEQWSRSIVNAALAALANMVNDFAPLREVCPWGHSIKIGLEDTEFGRSNSPL